MSKPKGKRIPRKPKAKPRAARVRLWPWLLAVVAAAAAAGGWYLWRLDRAVVRRFQNKRFSVPSAVYAQTTTLRAGLRLKPGDLVSLLRSLDYVPAAGKTPRTGEFVAAKREVRFVTHDYRLPGGAREPSRVVAARFDDAGLAALRDERTGGLLRTIALEPLLLGKFYGEERETRQLVAYDDLRARFAPALVAAEDNRFYDHPGIDVVGIARAAVVNILRGGIRQGGSTLTQQLVKNLWLTPERTFKRKLSEVAMALLLERHYTKQEIVETYANVIYLGQRGNVNLIGVGEASRYYFGKRVRDLSWAEAALLAGMIRSPAQYSPFLHPERARERRDAVLDKLAEMGALKPEQLQRAKAEPVRSTPPPPVTRRAAYFVDYVARSLADRHERDELRSAGLEVHTTLSAPLQLAAEAAVDNGLRYLESRDKRLAKAGLQAALVSLDPRTGRIVAYVGGRDYADSQFDRASQARRQIGSLVKPFVYYAAVAKGYPVSSTWSNEPLTIDTPAGPWTPENYEKESGGAVSMRTALERSMNLPTVRIATAVGLPAVKQVLEAAGVESPIKAYPALALGALEASPLEMARAYATLAALGARPEPMALSLVGTADGGVLQRYAEKSMPLLQAPPAYVVDQLLLGVVARGTGLQAQRIGYAGDLGGKTGTTSDYHDAWFAGFTPNLVTIVWIGSDDNATMRRPAAELALPVWGEYMMTAVQWIEPERFAQPEGVTWLEIDPASGERATYRCPQKAREVFVTGTEPAEACRLHQNTIESILNKLFR